MTEVLQDSQIWNEQMAQDRPVLVPQSDDRDTPDAALFKFRRWFAQFEDPSHPAAAGGMVDDGDAQWDGEASFQGSRNSSVALNPKSAGCASGVGMDW